MSLENINNEDVKAILNSSLKEIENIELTIRTFLSSASPAAPYMSMYAIIRACGAIERSFKIIIADFLLLHTENDSLSNFINNSIKNTSTNPSYENIVNVLKGIDKDLGDEFKLKVREMEDSERLRSSLKSLVNERNKFSHGGSPTSSAGDIIRYFQDSILILLVLEEVCS